VSSNKARARESWTVIGSSMAGGWW
jgi:hypothetical protein